MDTGLIAKISNEPGLFQGKKELKEVNQKNDDNLDSLDKNFIKFLQLLNSNKEKAITLLFKNKEKIPNLATLLWETPGIITIFIQELISRYIIVEFKEIRKEEIVHCYNIISIFQILVLDKEIKFKILNSHILNYFLPFLEMEVYSINHEILILMILGVFVVLMKSNDSFLLHYLANINLPYYAIIALQRMNGNNLTLPLYILQVMLSNSAYLIIFCDNQSLLTECLNGLGKKLSKDELPSKLLKSIIKIYCIIVENNTGKKLISQKVPKKLFKKDFYQKLDPSTKEQLDYFHSQFKNNRKLHEIITQVNNERGSLKKSDNNGNDEIDNQSETFSIHSGSTIPKINGLNNVENKNKY